MPTWLTALLAIAAFLVLAPLAAWVGRRYGRGIKGGAALAAMMLGMGRLIDPPVQARIEARREPVKGGAENDEPVDDPPGSGPSGG
jgi:hypothetical protein